MSAPGQANPMMPPPAAAASGDPIPGASPNDPTVGLMNHMSSVHNQHVAQYDQIREAEQKVALVREELDKLVKKGDMVTQDDVTEGATQLVAAGMGAAEVAGLLSEMPPNGEALQGWLASHDMALKANEAKLAALASQTRHNMGVGALRLAAAHSMMNPPPSAGGPQTIDQAPQNGVPPPGGDSGDATGSVNSLMTGGPNG